MNADSAPVPVGSVFVATTVGSLIGRRGPVEASHFARAMND